MQVSNSPIATSTVTSVRQRIAIITGGARGIGAAICKRLATSGVRVHFTYLTSELQAQELCDEIHVSGGTAAAYKIDVANESAVASFVRGLAEVEDGIDVLINNAAIIDDRLLIATSLKQWDNVIKTNLTGPYLMCKYVIPHMLDHGWGRIINISSNSVRIPGAGQSAYAASKGGLEALTRVLAAEVGRKGIRVNTVAPGRIATDMTENVRAALNGGESQPIWGEPHDIAGLVNFLVSDESSYIQGQTFTVDGGRLVMRNSTP